MQQRHALYVGVFLTSFYLLLLELVLTRIYSVILGYHFAFLAISIAMFGLGVSGIVVYVRPNWFPEAGLGVQLSRAATLAGLSALAVVLVLVGIPLSPSSLAALALIYTLSTLPFFFGGICLALAFARRPEGISQLYYFDLAGAALGSLATILLLNWLGGPDVVFVAGAIAIGAGLLFGWSARESAAADEAQLVRLRRFGLVAAVLSGALLALTPAIRPLALELGQRAYDVVSAQSPLPNPFEWYVEQYAGAELDTVVRFTRIVSGAAAALGVLAWLAARRGSALGFASGRWHLWLPVWCGVFTLLLFAAQLATDAVRVRFANGTFEAVSLFEEWNSISRIKVFPHVGWARSRIAAWGLSKSYDDVDIDQLHLKIDANAGTPVLRFEGDLASPQAQHLRYDVSSLGFYLVDEPHALIVGTGGGRDILTSLVFGARKVTGVELNPLILRAVNGALGDYTGHLDRREDVEYVLAEGRSFLRRSSERYDLIQVSLIDTWASLARGTLSLSENTLYTREAFDDYLARLAPGGVVSVSRWWQDPPWLLYRLLYMAIDALRAVGEDPAQHLLVVRGPDRVNVSGRVVNLLVTRSALAPADVQRISDVCDDLGFDLLYAPGQREGAHEAIRSFILSTPEERAEYARTADKLVTPSTDDQPFFFTTTRASALFLSGKGPLALVILARLLFLIPVLVLLFMLGPLVLLRGNELAALGPRGLRWIGYFACLGLGFIVIEIVLIQRFILFLGHPIYAVTLVVFGMLLSSSLGSLASGRLPDARLDVGLAAILAVLVTTLAAVHLALEPLLDAGFHLALAPRVAMAAALVALLGFQMGMLFPLGIRAITRESRSVVPWMWGVNCACSVLGTVVAACLAIYGGFRLTYLFGASFYVLAALLTFAALRRPAAPRPSLQA
jgi:hypothetical protein